MDDGGRIGKPSGLRRKASLNVTFCVKKEKSNNYKNIYTILQKSECDRTAEENETLAKSATAVREVTLRLEKRRRLKSRSEEIEDQPSVLAEKCRMLATALLSAQHLVVYSGAGVSTAARIPDYRGTNGIWTRLQQGKDIGCHDLSRAEPTLTHMALFALYRSGRLKHIVSQNCDGLHLRSGVPRAALSEVHGNMYLEVCTCCKLEYWRLFDVTEHTGRYSHETARLCFQKPLRDTIVHFGERGALRWPLNWKGACNNADKADIILCIGSSLKVLKRYPWLWCMDKPVKKRPLLFIVNLQWTPKDDQATLKINGKCDEVMSLVMSHLGMSVPKYIRHLDPIFEHATVLDKVELHTTSQPILKSIVDIPTEEQQQCKTEIKLEGGNIENDLTDNNGDDRLIINDFDCCGEEIKFDVIEEEVVITTTVVTDDCDDVIDDRIKMEIDDDDDKQNDDVINDGIVSDDIWRPFGGGSHRNDTAHDKNNDNDIDRENHKEKNIIIADIATAGFSVPLDEFDEFYSKIGKELAKTDDCGEFFQEFNNSSVVSVDDADIAMRNNKSTNVKSQGNLKINNKNNDIGDKNGLVDKKINKKICDKNEISNNSCSSSSNSKCISTNSRGDRNNYSIISDLKKKSEIYLSDCVQTVPLDLSLVKTSLKSSSTDSKIVDKSASKTAVKSDSDTDDSDCKSDFGAVFCRFCNGNYGSDVCQFYKKLIPVIPDAGPFCYCCDDDDTDNDNPVPSTDGSTGNNRQPSDKSSTVPNASSGGASGNKVPIINPGWFGKGYRKRTKKKR